MPHVDELFNFDRQYEKLIIGTDEAGRGSAVGDVFAAAVCFEKLDKELINSLSLLNDSKKLSAKNRDELYEILKTNTVNFIGRCSAEEIEDINILNASLKSMNIAVCSVAGKVKSNDILILVDGCCLIKNCEFNQKCIIKGDGQSASIAAASILAKVERDRYLIELDREFPEYGWKNNMGYLTKEHLDAIDKYGLTPYHRKSFLEKYFAQKSQLKLF